MKRIVEDQQLSGVTFHGRVTTPARQNLLESAHVHVFASHREGWGLTVSEAGAAGTPSVGYDAPGVRDSISDARLLAPTGDETGLARIVLRLARDPALYEDVRQKAWERARALNWNHSAEVFAAALGLPAEEPARAYRTPERPQSPASIDGRL